MIEMSEADHSFPLKPPIKGFGYRTHTVVCVYVRCLSCVLLLRLPTTCHSLLSAMSRTSHSFVPGTFRLLFLWLSLLNLLLPISASPAPATSDRKLAKRVRQAFPYFDDSYEGRADKGEWLKGLLPLDPAKAQEYNGGQTVASPFQDPEEVLEWGWTPNVYFFPYAGGRAPDFGNLLSPAFEDPALPVDATENALWNLVHDREFKKANGQTGYVSTIMIPSIVSLVLISVLPAHDGALHQRRKSKVWCIHFRLELQPYLCKERE